MANLSVTIHQLSVDAIRLHQELLQTEVGMICPYSQLGAAIGKPVDGATTALRAARRLALRENGVVFACIRNEGVKRLDDEGIVELAGAETLGVRRRARRVGRKLGLVHFEALREESRMRACGIAGVLAVVADLASERSIVRVTKAAAGRADQLPIAATLKALGLRKM